jgi:glyoxylase-like metal-dependent hydrolase (beta-lactamase superfamily II)
VKATPVSDNLIQLNRLGFVNAFLVREDDGFTLVDTTLSGNAGAIVEAAGAAGLPIVRIALTHAHGDHIGSLDALNAELPDAEVILGAREFRLVEQERGSIPTSPRPRCAAAGRRSRRHRRGPWSRTTAWARCACSSPPATRPATSPSWTSATGR